MNVQELRLGNWVHHKTLPDKNVRITAIDELGHISYHDGRCNNESFITTIEPIRLTPKILGDNFKGILTVQGDHTGYYCLPCNIFFNISPDGKVYINGDSFGEPYINENPNRHISCTYVHQLQNIFYVLTRQELEIEL